MSRFNDFEGHLNQHQGWTCTVSPGRDFISVFPLLNESEHGIWTKPIAPTPIGWVFSYDAARDTFRKPVMQTFGEVEEEHRPKASKILRAKMRDLDAMVGVFCK